MCSQLSYDSYEYESTKECCVRLRNQLISALSVKFIVTLTSYSDNSCLLVTRTELNFCNNELLPKCIAYIIGYHFHGN